MPAGFKYKESSSEYLPFTNTALDSASTQISSTLLKPDNIIEIPVQKEVLYGRKITQTKI